MAKSNKELAVELYCAFLSCSGSLFSNPNFSGKIQFPTNNDMAENIRELTEKLSTIQDN